MNAKISIPHANTCAVCGQPARGIYAAVVETEEFSVTMSIPSCDCPGCKAETTTRVDGFIATLAESMRLAN